MIPAVALYVLFSLTAIVGGALIAYHHAGGRRAALVLALVLSAFFVLLFVALWYGALGPLAGR